MVGSAAAAHLLGRAETPVLPAPVPPERFAADAGDPAGRAARLMARRLQTFRNYRAAIADATWIVDDTARWSVRSVPDCHGALARAGVPFQAWSSVSSILAAPVRVQGEVYGVRFRGIRIACELGVETCLAPAPEQERARKLLAIVCDLHATRVFASVLTPNYNNGHRDHFHIDARPDGPRLFIR